MKLLTESSNEHRALFKVEESDCRPDQMADPVSDIFTNDTGSEIKLELNVNDGQVMPQHQEHLTAKNLKTNV